MSSGGNFVFVGPATYGGGGGGGGAPGMHYRFFKPPAGQIILATESFDFVKNITTIGGNGLSIFGQVLFDEFSDEDNLTLLVDGDLLHDDVEPGVTKESISQDFQGQLGGLHIIGAQNNIDPGAHVVTMRVKNDAPDTDALVRHFSLMIFEVNVEQFDIDFE